MDNDVVTVKSKGKLGIRETRELDNGVLYFIYDKTVKSCIINRTLAKYSIIK